MSGALYSRIVGAFTTVRMGVVPFIRATKENGVYNVQAEVIGPENMILALVAAGWAQTWGAINIATYFAPLAAHAQAGQLAAIVQAATEAATATIGVRQLGTVTASAVETQGQIDVSKLHLAVQPLADPVLIQAGQILAEKEDEEGGWDWAEMLLPAGIFAVGYLLMKGRR